MKNDGRAAGKTSARLFEHRRSQGVQGCRVTRAAWERRQFLEREFNSGGSFNISKKIKRLMTEKSSSQHQATTEKKGK